MSLYCGSENVGWYCVAHENENGPAAQSGSKKTPINASVLSPNRENHNIHARLVEQMMIIEKCAFAAFLWLSVEYY